MTNIDLSTVGRASRVSLAARALWPVPVIIAVAVIAQQRLVFSHYDVGGHAGEHLMGASAPFMAAAVVCILFWTTPRARVQLDLLLVCAMWFATTVLVMAGNLRVVNDLVDAGYSRTPTGSVPDVADHALANSSVWYAWAAALVVVIAWRRRRHIGNRATITAAIISVIVPPWIIPGAGVIVLAIVRVVQRGRGATSHTSLDAV